MYSHCSGNNSLRQMNFLHSAVCNDLHLFSICFILAHAVSMVVTVKTTVHTVIFTIIGNIKRREQIYRVAENVCGSLPAVPLLPSASRTALPQVIKSALKSSIAAGFMLKASLNILLHIFSYSRNHSSAP